MVDLIGNVLVNRYRVDSFIGRGGMAEVYKVWDQERMSFLAMKLLHQDIATDKIFLRRFRREAATLAKLQHPNIVRFYGFEQVGRLAFMLMDFIDGESLKLKIFDADQPFSAEMVMGIIRPVIGALQYAHNQGMVHCDLKPANIMINENNKVFLTDFGIARMTDAATATMVGMGTPAYMAPEQARGLDPTPQSDIYSLGVVLFEMLTGGERPFTGERARTTGSTSEKVRWEQVHLKPPSPRELNKDISPEFEAVMLKCLSKDPSERFTTVLDLLNAISATFEVDEKIQATEIPEVVIQDEGKATTPVEDRKAVASELDAVKPPEITFPRKLLPLLAIFGLVIVSIVGFGLVFNHFNPQSMSTQLAIGGSQTDEGFSIFPSYTPVPSIMPTEPPPQVPIRTPFGSPPVSPTLTGTEVEFLIQTETQVKEDAIFLFPPDEINTPSNPQVITSNNLDELESITNWSSGTTMDAKLLSWSPDSGKLAFTRGVFDTWILDVETGEITQKLFGEFSDATINDIAWSPDGSMVAVLKDKTLEIWDPISGKLIWNIDSTFSFRRNILWYPDSESIATSDGKYLRVWDLEAKKEIGGVELSSSTQILSLSLDGTKLAAGDYIDIVVWDVHSFNQVSSMDLSGIRQIIWMPGTDDLLIVSRNKINLWDAKSDIIQADINLPDISNILAWSPGSNFLTARKLTGGRSSLPIINTSSGEIIHDLGYGDWVDLAWSPDGTLIAASDEEGRIQIWGLQSKLSLLASASETSSVSSDLIFLEDFEDGEANFKEVWGTEKLQEKYSVDTSLVYEIRNVGDGSLQLWFGNHSWVDYAVEFRFKALEFGTDKIIPCVKIRGNMVWPGTKHYEVNYYADLKYFDIAWEQWDVQGEGTKFLVIRKYPFYFNPKNWNHIRVEITGFKIKVYFNGDYVFEATESLITSIKNKRDSGVAGITIGQDQLIWIDDIRVEKLD